MARTITKRAARRKPSVRRVFLTGVAILTPVFVSVWVIKFIFMQIDGAVTPLIMSVMRLSGLGWLLESGWLDYVTPVVSIVVLTLMVYLVGLIGGNVIGRQLLGWVDKVLLAIPILRGIYSATRQFIDTFSTDKGAFRKVVVLEYPRKGAWTLGFLTNDIDGEIRDAAGAPLCAIFLPTTPNPTSGWLVFTAKKDVVELSMSVDDAFKMIVSGGVLLPGSVSARRSLPIDDVTGVTHVPQRPSKV
jgi:uncharacterized membrane protein